MKVEPALVKIKMILLAGEPCLNIHQWGPICLHVANCNLAPIEWKVFFLLHLQYFFDRYNASRMLQVSYKEFVRIIQRRREPVLPTLKSQNYWHYTPEIKRPRAFRLWPLLSLTNLIFFFVFHFQPFFEFIVLKGPNGS